MNSSSSSSDEVLGIYLHFDNKTKSDDLLVLWLWEIVGNLGSVLKLNLCC